MRRVRVRFAQFAVCATVALAAGCSGQLGTGAGPRIAFTGGGFASAVIPNRTDGSAYPLTNAIGLCIDKPGSIEILDVSLEHSEGGLKIDTFALTPKTGQALPNPVTDTETLQELGFRPGSNVVRTQCSSWATTPPYEPQPPSQGDEPGRGVTDLELQFSKPGAKTARGGIVDVKYKSGNQILTYKIGFGLVLCAGDESKLPECRAKSYGWK